MLSQLWTVPVQGDQAPHPLFRERRKFAVRKLRQKLPAFGLRAYSLVLVAIRLFHLLVVDIANAVLRLRRFFHRGIEEDEVLIFRFGLSHPVCSALSIPAIGDRQLGFG